MLGSASVSLLLGASSLVNVALGAAVGRVRRDEEPLYDHDPNASVYCSWWVDLEEPTACATVVENNFVDLAKFLRWNPDVPAACGNAILPAQRSYCVESEDIPNPQPSSSSSSSAVQPPKTTSTSSSVVQPPKTTSSSSTPVVVPPTTTSTKPATPTVPSNGIITPTPIQSGMVDNCNKFHFVEENETCDTIAKQYGISTAQFTTWNKAAGSTCSGLWAKTWACVGLIGGNPAPGETPTPINPGGMATNCGKFVRVNQGDSCDSITSLNGISKENLLLYNPGIGGYCLGLTVGTYVCVALRADPTQPNNGVATPQPTNPGAMVTNCNKFARVNSGEDCNSLAFWNGMESTEQFMLWNPSVGSDCRTLMAEKYVCVGLIPSSNGIKTPQPTHPGIAGNCKKFVRVNSGDTCDKIAAANKITTQQFINWNTGVGSGCKSLWAEVYACVGV